MLALNAAIEAAVRVKVAEVLMLLLTSSEIGGENTNFCQPIRESVKNYPRSNFETRVTCFGDYQIH